MDLCRLVRVRILSIDCSGSRISSLLEGNTSGLEPIMQGCKSRGSVRPALLPWLGARLQVSEWLACWSGCVSRSVQTHGASLKQPLSLQVAAGFLGLRCCVVTSDFTDLHVADCPLCDYSYPKGHGEGENFTESLAQSEQC